MKRIYCSIIITIIFLTAACAHEEHQEIVVAEQYGLAYAPVVIMREKGFLEEAAGDDYTVRWEKLGNTAAIREAMLSDSLDVGFMGIPPFLIGADQGMNWKIISGLSVSPLGLMVSDPEIQRLEDLAGNGKIALPQPGSIQHILLAMAAEAQFGDAAYFDQQLLSMKHPEGYQALLTDENVKAHFTSPPYLFQEMEEEGIHQLLSGEEAFGGEFSFIVGACREEFYRDRNRYKVFKAALEKSVRFINEEPEAAVAILADVYELSEEVTAAYVYERGLVYKQEVLGVQRFSDFMFEAGYLIDHLEEEQVIW